MIWEDPLRQGLALFVAAVALTCVVAALRKGAFAPQWLIEIRHFPEDSDRAEVAVACSGKAVVVEITCQLTDGTERKIRSNSPLTDFGTYSSLIFNLPDRPVSSLEFAAHRVTAEFEADPIAGELTDLKEGTQQHSIELNPKTGQTKIAMSRGPQQLKLCLPQ